MGSSFVNEGHTEWSPFWILPGVAVPIEIYREASNSARQNSAEENTFPQLRLNQWVKQSVRWMPTHVWNQKHTLLICVSWKAVFVVAGSTWHPPPISLLSFSYSHLTGTMRSTGSHRDFGYSKTTSNSGSPAITSPTTCGTVKDSLKRLRVTWCTTGISRSSLRILAPGLISERSLSTGGARSK